MVALRPPVVLNSLQRDLQLCRRFSLLTFVVVFLANVRISQRQIESASDENKDGKCCQMHHR